MSDNLSQAGKPKSIVSEVEVGVKGRLETGSAIKEVIVNRRDAIYCAVELAQTIHYRRHRWESKQAMKRIRSS